MVHSRQFELKLYFKYPLYVAAKRSGKCTTTLKYMCRSIGIARWPFRKLNPLNREIELLKRKISMCTNTIERREMIKTLKILKQKHIVLSYIYPIGKVKISKKEKLIAIEILANMKNECKTLLK